MSARVLFMESVILEYPFIRNLVVILRTAPPSARPAIVKRLIQLADLDGWEHPPAFSFIEVDTPAQKV